MQDLEQDTHLSPTFPFYAGDSARFLAMPLLYAAAPLLMTHKPLAISPSFCSFAQLCFAQILATATLFHFITSMVGFDFLSPFISGLFLVRKLPSRALTKKLMRAKMERVSEVLQLPVVIERGRSFCLESQLS